jgi:glycine oxidase
VSGTEALKELEISVVGAGIAGLWQAYTLAGRGHDVRLVEQTATPFTNAASQYAGAMLAPFCEREIAGPIVQELGLRALDIWEETFPGLVRKGTLVVAQARDRSELTRFARCTTGHRPVDADALGALEPDLAGRFREGLFYEREAHVEPGEAMGFLLGRIRRLGAKVSLGEAWKGGWSGAIVDCRGYSAKSDLPSLRGVRGERIIVQTSEIALSRPIRLLHPRTPLYVVPWGMGTYAIGATVIESDDVGPVTLRSALELLGAAYTLHPAFGEGRIVALDAGIRPAFPDNIPRIVARGRHIFVNGLYRHGFLLAPILAEAVANYLESGTKADRLFAESEAELLG